MKAGDDGKGGGKIIFKKSELLLVTTNIPQTSAQSMHKDRTNRGALLFVS